GNNSAPWLSMGRLSPRQPSEAEFLVDKIIGYDKNSAQDTWKARILFVGDDSWTPEREEGTLHSGQAEALAEQHTPNEFEKRKIYLAEYPTVNTSQGRRKPGAYQAIIDEINRGVLIVNFVGHGNPTVWAHEAVFSVQTSIPQLENANKLAVFFAATCNFSQFDDPKRYTGSELLLNRPGGGAIGAVSATRKVFSQDNALLNQRIFDMTFGADQYGRIRVERVSTAMYLVKSNFGNSVNDQKFFFMGDPTMRLQFPRGYAAIDTINSEPMDSVGGLPRTTPVQLRALSRVTLKGTIRDDVNRIDSTFGGKVSIIVNDASRRVIIVNFSPGVPSWPYLAVGGTIYRGENSVSSGRFEATFIVPKDISYADSTTRGRLVAYYSNSSGADGFGYTSKVRVGGTDSTAAPDTAGPSIGIFLDTRGFRAGDMVGERPILYVDLADSSGINTSGSGIGHRIEAWLNNSAQSKDITEFYTSKMDSYQEGTVTFQLNDVLPGRNDIRVRAWDTYNNANTGESHFVVTSTDKLRISDVLNYPNPFASGTSFTFRQNQLLPINATVKVYTLAGRLIQTLESYSTGEPFIRIPWDGRDRDGDVLANGVYLYKVIVRTVDGRFSSEALGKLAVLK
ncbi:MAG: type IX secretion system sortase PorU, partial [Ignavibacteriae bacterium]|nr:type IX secretion system sortase PorU [Ignavibacteriota bacterium]